jgi:hypothetical protein
MACQITSMLANNTGGCTVASASLASSISWWSERDGCCLRRHDLDLTFAPAVTVPDNVSDDQVMIDISHVMQTTADVDRIRIAPKRTAVPSTETGVPQID